MSNSEKAQKMRKEFNEPDVFGGTISFRQIWWIIKFAKTVRKFARSNAALYNLCNEIFRGIASFTAVTKIKDDGSTYLGLEIKMKMPDGAFVAEVMSDESESE
jgi:hypothetical protein